MFQKYVKPESLTWWSAIMPLVAGILIASEPMHGQAGLVQSIRLVIGDVAPGILINAGLAGIGLRGALS